MNKEITNKTISLSRFKSNGFTLVYDNNLYKSEIITSKMEVLNSDLNIKENRWYELIKMEEDLVSN